MAKKVVVVGAFDTKGGEHQFIIDIFLKNGLQVITVNTGVMGATDLFKIDIASDKVAAAGGTTLSTLQNANDRGAAIKAMADGAAVVVKELYDSEGFDGIIGMGGTAGTAVVTSAMRALPFGLPKICVSTVASGDTSPYLGTSDIILIPSLTDIAGINSLSRVFLSNAAGALTGMVQVEIAAAPADEKPIIAASMFGNTTPCIDACREMLTEKGYEVLVFHATGAGGKTMEKLIKDGLVKGALDITTTEWADTIGGGVFDAGSERLDGPGQAGIPHLISPGCIDMCNFGGPDTIPAKYKDRLFYKWNPNVTLMRTTAEENAEMGKIFAEKANAAKGKVAFLIPLQGYSILDSVKDGEPQLFWDPAADKAFIDA
ncbi:MAG: Tm-1-like ATP-binding domain-containing protein, partial [Mucilaginibacter sp.]